MNDCCRETLESLRTAQEVAELLGLSRVQVWRTADRLGIGVQVGPPGARVRLYTPEDVERMRAR